MSTSSYSQLTAELTARLPGLSAFLAQRFITRAWRDIRNDRPARPWSFLLTDGALVCPPQITAGTANITQFSATVTMDATATTALTPYLAGTPLLTQMQIRFGGANNTGTVGQVYQIQAAIGSPLVLTLDRVVQEATNTGTGYQVYRCYVVPPISDFERWNSVTDVADGWTLALDKTSAYFDAIDPQRMSQGQAYCVGMFQGTTTTGLGTPSPLYELWPHPVQGQTFYVRMRRYGTPFSLPTDVAPDPITDEVIMEKALQYAYPHCQANIGNFPTMKGVSWLPLLQGSTALYTQLVRDAHNQDDNVRPTSIIRAGHGLRDARPFPYPIDAAFLQSHLVSF